MSDHPEKKVLTEDARKSRNFYRSDRILRQYLEKHLSTSAMEYMDDKLDRLGRQAAGMMDELSFQADKHPPRLKKRSPLGEDIDEVEFHPAYSKLLEIAAESEMFYVKYNPGLRDRFTGDRNKLCFAAGQLYAMSELGVYCPLCMTDGAAHLVDRHADPEIQERILPGLSAREGGKLRTGAMFITEKTGGSDVGANLCRATPEEGTQYRLNGEKWFCSNVNAEVVMTLARTGPPAEGTRGLSLFLVENNRGGEKGSPFEIIRLKDKLGVRSMATGEIGFRDTKAVRIGEENRGFKLMAEMINISRIYNSAGALGASRRALIESYQYLNHRITFGRRASEHALVREKLHELGSLHLANQLLVWRAIRAMDAADTGDKEEAELLRILTPVAKWHSAEQGVYMVRECMELMGGNGYIEDFVMPRLLRDINVLPIWEGSGNIIVLDILRATEKSNGLEILIGEIREAAGNGGETGRIIEEHLERVLTVWNNLSEEADRDAIEATSRPLFEKLIRLYQLGLMVLERDETNRRWIDPAVRWFSEELGQISRIRKPPAPEEIHDLMGWEY